MATATAVQLLTIVDAAHHLGISRSKVYELLAAGELPSVRIGRTRRIALAAIEEFVVEHRSRARTVPRVGPPGLSTSGYAALATRPRRAYRR